MPSYDFTTLSPHDFELLTRDLLQAELGVPIESFKSGRDKGIDLRYARYSKASSRTTIVQCKHYAKTGFSGLRSALLRTEKPKLDTLRPDSYRLVTSVSLSPQNKDSLLAILKPYARKTSDILGCEDLNNLIGKHAQIERKHFKLWIGSVAVLQQILTNDIFSRTYLDAASIRRRLSLFVQTPALERARNILSKHGHCLLSGIPGIGKTTTAEMLLTIALEEGWEAVHLASGAHEALKAMTIESRQLFFYDDFLGRTSLLDNALGKNEDRDLIRLFDHCRQHKQTKRVILTTREYILEQAKQSSELLRHAELPNCIISLEDYNTKIRAQILINHLFFYDVPEETRRHLVASGAARKIIRHKNYSPRIVEWMCQAAPRCEDEPKFFAKRFIKTLDDPSRLWEHAFDNQISPAARDLIFGLASLDDNCDSDALYSVVLAFKGETCAGPAEVLPLRKALAELEGNFIRIDTDGTIAVIKFHNPSVKDFTDGLLRKFESAFAQLFARAVFYEQLTYLSNTLGSLARLVDDSTFARKVQDTYLSPSASIESQVLNGKMKMVRRPVRISCRLTEALKMAEKRSVKTRVALAQFALVYLRTPKMDSDSASAAIELYRQATAILSSAAQPVVLTLPELVQTLRADFRDVSDYKAATSALEWDAHEEILDQIADAFLGFAEVALVDVTENAGSYSDLDSRLGEFREVATALGLDGQIDFGEAQEVLNQMGAAEDYYANLHDDDTYESRHDDREDEQSAEEMLNSLMD